MEYLADLHANVEFLPVMLFRVLVSLVLGLCIGIEREIQRQPAGLRTHMLICVGATMATLVSIYLPLGVKPLELYGDAARIAAQIISGVGFLGAGAIIKMGANVRGITTAATIWIVAAIGMAVGVGMILTAVVGTLVVLLVLVLFERLERRHFYSKFYKVVEVEYQTRTTTAKILRELVLRDGLKIRTMDLRTTQRETCHMSLYCSLSEFVDPEDLLRELMGATGVVGVTIRQQMG